MRFENESDVCFVRFFSEEIEAFFRSDWFEQLTGVDGSVILRKLKQEENIHDE